MSEGQRVERAVVLAAGRGARLSPISDVTPKPLVRIHGRRIIDTLLDALLAAGIREIYIVRGYMAQAFDALAEDYPQIQFVDNPDWQSSNNVSSLAYAGERVRNAYVLEGDLWLRNTFLISPNQQESNYLAFPVNKTEDWCFTLNDSGYIRSLSLGGYGCEQMVGISYWTDADGGRLAQRVKDFYASETNRQRFWDEVALGDYLSEFKVRVRECHPEDVQEVDTVTELAQLDSTYKRYVTDSKEMG